MELDVTPFSLGTSVQSLSNSFDEIAVSKGVKFEIRCPEYLKETLHQEAKKIFLNTTTLRTMLFFMIAFLPLVF